MNASSTTPPENAAAGWLAPRRADYLSDLAALVAIDSPTTYPAGVNRVIDWVAERAESWGATLERRSLDSVGDQLAARWPGTGGPRILLCGHADTVHPVGTAGATVPLTPDPAQPDHLLGAGAADMKGGLVTALYAVRAATELGLLGGASVTLAVVPDEEAGSLASVTWLTELAAEHDVGLVLESARANGAIVTGRKGAAFWTLFVDGIPAHAGVEPQKGANAFVQLAHHAVALDAIAASIRGATLVMGTAAAGTAPNVVPAQAWLTIDARAFDVEPLNALVAAVETAVEQTAGCVPRTASRLVGGLNKQPMPRTDAIAAIYEVARRGAACLGFGLLEEVSGGTSDANTLCASGLTVLDGLGPVGGALHSAGEYVQSESLVPRTALVAGLMSRVAAGEWRANT